MRLFFTALICVLLGQSASAFCGFYVARADGALYNSASKVVFVRDGRKSVITMSSDYRGAPSEFAMIVPTPTILRQNQIHEVDSDIIDHLDAYTAPRLVEYFDPDPCAPEFVPMVMSPTVDAASSAAPRLPSPRALGVRVEAQYAIGSYDIAILSAEDSDGLVTYLLQEGYNIPDGADLVLADYVAMGMKFFVARVNLQRHSAGEAQELKPLQIAFRSRNFMLPLQLGKINAETQQDLLLMTLTKSGRVESSNYRNGRIPSDINVPVFVESIFPEFYRRVFAVADKPDTVMTEYAWNMQWCDPCAADPLSATELKTLGATWVRDGVPPEVFVTRMHLQYDRSEFQRDLLLRVTNDNSNFQGRYVMNHPFDGEITCDAGREYVRAKRRELQEEATQLRALTSWGMPDINARIARTVPARYR